MKKFTFILLAVFIVAGCTPRKKKTKSGPINRFVTYYNTLFNSKDALDTEMQNRNKAFKDNFYEPYIPILTDAEVTQELHANFASNNDNSDIATPTPGGRNANRGNTTAEKKGVSILQISEAKALKAISKYSVLVGSTEKNKYMFDAYMLLAKSRLYQGKHLESLDALGYIMNTMGTHKKVNLARIYQAQNYTKLKDYNRANTLFTELKEEKLSKEQERTLSIFYAEMLLKANKKEQAIEELEEAFTYNKVRKTKSRIAYLRGQILASLNKKQEARESFVTAYKYAYDYEFEVKSQLQIAKTFEATNGNYDEAKAYLEKIAKKGTYASRKNELYYAMGLMALNAKNHEEADAYFKKSIEAKMSDPQIRGLVFSEIGKKHFDKDDYLTAGAYYDSALAVMNYAPEKERLGDLTKNIKKLSGNYYLIKKNDSILALTKMSPEQQKVFFQAHIDKIKAKEALAEIERRKAERSKGFEDGDYSANSLFANSSGGTFDDFGGNGGKASSFYFANTNNIPRGERNFKQIWGTRTLSDNWRYAAKSATIEDIKNDAMGISTVPDPRRYEPDFYIEKIPVKAKDIAVLKKDRDTASLGLGIMFENFFSNTKLATKTLYELVDGQPDADTELKALYQAFVINYKKNPQDAQRAKELILQKYPYTSYAEFVANPKSTDFNKASESVSKLYADAYDFYNKGKYEESRNLVQKIIDENPKDALVPKLYLLNAYNAGKTAGKEVMILQLEQIVLSYGNTPEGIKAKEILKYMKSDVALELTDDEGNTLNNTPPMPPAEEEAAPTKFGNPVGSPSISPKDQDKLQQMKAMPSMEQISDKAMRKK